MEIIIPDDTFITSETDAKGIITSVNDAFLQITGYEEDELIGKEHNIIRHPDMPKEAFADMWKTIQSGKRWSGIVKNMAKNGDHYWVYAMITKINRQDGVKSVYTSIRQKCSRREIEEMCATLGIEP